MLDRNVVVNGVKMLLINFSIDKPKEELTEYTNFVTGYLRLENVTNEDFNFALTKFIKNTSGTNYNKLPSVGDYMRMLNKADQSAEDLARIQSHVVANTLKSSKGIGYIADKLANHSLISFDDAITNYIIKNEFNELKNVILDDFFTNRFIKAYVAAFNLGYSYKKPLKYYSSENNEVLLIGNKNKIDIETSNPIICIDYNIGERAEEFVKIDFENVKKIGSDK